jgi:acyl carrier protein
MQTSNIEHEIRTFLVDSFLSGRKEGLRDEEPLLGNVIDSTGVVEFVIFLQEHFAITVEDDEVTTDKIGSLKSAVAFVKEKLGSKRT